MFIDSRLPSDCPSESCDTRIRSDMPHEMPRLCLCDWFLGVFDSLRFLVVYAKLCGYSASNELSASDFPSPLVVLA